MQADDGKGNDLGEATHSEVVDVLCCEKRCLVNGLGNEGLGSSK